jgi:hypothetical protein
LARRSFSSLRSCALLMMVCLVVLTGIAAAINRSLHPAAGLTAALVAGALVSAGMMAALWITSFAQKDRSAIQYGLAGQLLRLALPVAGALVLERVSPELAQAKLFGCVMGIYLPALVVETLLAVRMLGQSTGEVCRG